VSLGVIAIVPVEVLEERIFRTSKMKESWWICVFFAWLSLLLRIEAFISSGKSLIIQQRRFNPVTLVCRDSFGCTFMSATPLAKASGSSPEMDYSNLLTTKELNDELRRLCESGLPQSAFELLEISEERFGQAGATGLPDEMSFTIVIESLAGQGHTRAPDLADRMLQRMIDYSKEHPACLPTAKAYNAVIFAWSKNSEIKQAAARCNECLEELWSQYEKTKDTRFIPPRSSYISTITALSRSRGGRRAAEQAEELLESMEKRRVKHPHLAPTTLCTNAVL
jgi:hypothetical protein